MRSGAVFSCSIRVHPRSSTLKNALSHRREPKTKTAARGRPFRCAARAEDRARGGSLRLGGGGGGVARSDVLADTRGLALAIAQVVQLRARDLAAALDLHGLDRRAEALEHALDARAVRDLAHRERRMQTAALDRD